MPMQCFVSCVLPVLMVALYTMSLLMHLFCSGHAFLFVVTVICSILWLTFPNYACVAACDN